MREQLNPQCPNASDPSARHIDLPRQPLGWVEPGSYPPGIGEKITFPGLGSAAGCRCRRSGRLGAPRVHSPLFSEREGRKQGRRARGKPSAGFP